MFKKLTIGVVVMALVAMMSVTVFAEDIEIEFWHAMSGGRLNALEAIVDSFNEANPGITVTPVFSGSYAEAMTRAMAAYRTGRPPHILQVYEVGTQTMLDSGAIMPIFEMGDYDFSNVVDPILNYYSVGGKLYSFPFNSSTAMMYYNKDAFRAAGLDPENPPKTFDELMEMGLQIVESGAASAGFSQGWPAWIIEQMHTTHDQFLANNENGRSGRATEFLLNQPFGVEVISKFVELTEAGVHAYGGREYKANSAFLAGDIAMLFQSTSSLASIEKAADFEVGTAFLPRLEGWPQGKSVIGGATLWVMKGHSDEEYEAVMKFLQWNLQADLTIQWHKSTGYFPATKEAVQQLEDEGWFVENPNFRTAFDQILSGNDTPAAQGVLLGNFVEIRDIVDTALEKAYTGVLTAEEAAEEATRETNRVLSDYARMYQ